MERSCTCKLNFVFTSFIRQRTGTALSDDNGRALVTTAPWSVGLKQLNYVVTKLANYLT